MRSVDISSLPLDINALLEQAREEDLLVRLADGSEFIVIAVDDFDRELARTRCNEKLMALLEDRARQTKPVPLDDVMQDLGLSEAP